LMNHHGFKMNCPSQSISILSLGVGRYNRISATIDGFWSYWSESGQFRRNLCLLDTGEGS